MRRRIAAADGRPRKMLTKLDSATPTRDPGRGRCVRPLSSPASASKESKSEWISADITNTCLVIGLFVLAITSHPDASCEGNCGDVKF
jgi:hypothetical protein